MAPPHESRMLSNSTRRGLRARRDGVRGKRSHSNELAINHFVAAFVQNSTMFRALFAALCVTCASLTSARATAQEVRQQIQITAPGPGEMPPLMGPNREPKTGTGILRGRVRASDTGAPIRRAQVRITSPDIGVKTALTDAQGRYEFKELPASRFNVSVTKSGFVMTQYGQNRPFEPGRPIELTDAQVMEKVDVSLPRGSVPGASSTSSVSRSPTPTSARCGCSSRMAGAASCSPAAMR
jgi:hypothetical protein